MLLCRSMLLAVVLPAPLAPAFAGAPQLPQALPCHSYAEVARQLGDRYDEAPVSAGIEANGNLLQVFASGRSGTWTILSTRPDGLTCVVAAGRSWQPQEPADTDPAA